MHWKSDLRCPEVTQIDSLIFDQNKLLWITAKETFKVHSKQIFPAISEMVNGRNSWSAVLICILQHKSASTLHYTVPTNGKSYTHSHTSGAAIRSNLGFSILPEDTSTCRPEELGIKPLTFWLVDNLLYQLSHSRTNIIKYRFFKN